MKIYKNNFNQEEYSHMLKNLKDDETIYDFENYYAVVKTAIPTNDEILQRLRSRRNVECFSIINRGQFWYNKLSDQEKNELQSWYKAWLDVTKTKVIPQNPTWLN